MNKKSISLFAFTVFVVLVAIVLSNGAKTDIEVSEFTQEKGWRVVEKSQISGTWQAIMKPNQQIVFNPNGLLPINLCLYNGNEKHVVEPGNLYVASTPEDLLGEWEIMVTPFWQDCR